MCAEEFLSRLTGLLAEKGNNKKMMNRKTYDQFIEELRGTNASRSARRFFLENVMGIGEDPLFRLRKVKSGKLVVPIEDYYECIRKIHVDLGHAGQLIAGKSIHEIYDNIGIREIQLFLDLCTQCQLKAQKQHKHLVVKPIMEEDFGSRCQVDLIDFQTRPAGEYKFVLTFQDHFTKYVRLRPLKSKIALEVAQVLREIFMDVGCFDIMHTDNGGEFVNKVSF